MFPNVLVGSLGLKQKMQRFGGNFPFPFRSRIREEKACLEQDGRG